MNDNHFNSAIRQGIIQKIYADSYTCDVYFPEQDVVITDLIIAMKGTRNPEYDLPNENDLALCILIPPSLSDGWVIACGYNDQDKPPESDAKIFSRTFADGSKLSYDMNNSLFSAKFSNGAEISAQMLDIVCPIIKIKGNVIIDGNLSALNISVGSTGKSLQGAGELTINGKSWKAHNHSAGSYKDGDARAVTGSSGEAL